MQEIHLNQAGGIQVEKRKVDFELIEELENLLMDSKKIKMEDDIKITRLENELSMRTTECQNLQYQVENLKNILDNMRCKMEEMNKKL